MDDRFTVFFLRHFWAAPLLWMALHSADYYLTVTAVKVRKRFGDRIRFEGSMEVNPVFQKAVEAGALFPPRFVFSLFFVAGLLLLLGLCFWGLEALTGSVPEPLADLFALLLGMLVFSRASVIGNHLAILYRLRLHRDPLLARGELLLSRRAAILPGVIQATVQAAILAIACLLSPSWWLAGGVLGLLAVAGFYLVHGLRAPKLGPPPAP